MGPQDLQVPIHLKVAVPIDTSFSFHHLRVPVHHSPECLFIPDHFEPGRKFIFIFRLGEPTEEAKIPLRMLLEESLYERQLD
jgi:hypothetical protein